MHQYSITENDANQRLDKFLKKLFPNATRDLIYKLNRKEKIKIVPPLTILPLSRGDEAADVAKKVRGKRQDNEYKLQVGEIVQVYLSESEIESLQKENKVEDSSAISRQQAITPNLLLRQAFTPTLSQGERGQIQQKLSKKDIVFEDGTLLLVNKSAGLNVHPGDHKTSEVSLIQQVHDYFGNTLNSLTFKPSLVHRIDRDTSGLVMIAKQKEALTRMSEAFQKKDALQKTYFALVIGKLSRSEGTIKKALLRKEDAKNENKVIVSEKGQEAITHYKVLEAFEVKIGEHTQIISAVEITIETGRMHQIRVHMAHIGNPVLGDKAYGDKKLNAYFAKNYGISRQILHAWKLSFFHPKTNKKMNLIARFKEDMEGLVVRLRELK